jgi:hypothetical protein
VLLHSQEKPIRRGDRRWFNDKLNSIGSLAGADARLKAVDLWASIVHEDSSEAAFGGADALDELHAIYSVQALERSYMASVPASLVCGITTEYRNGGCNLDWLRDITLSIAKPALLAGLEIDAKHDDIREHGKKLADLCLSLLKTPEAAMMMAENRLDKLVAGKTWESKLARIICPKFWIKQVRQTLRLHREICHIKLAPTRINYCSIDASREYQSMLDSITKWSTEHEFVSDAGEKFQAPSPEQTQKNQYAKLVAQTKGIADSATAKKYIARIVTITLDTQYHATTSYARPGAKNPKKDRIRVRNPRYGNMTPREGQDWLQHQWTNFRTAFGNRGIDIEFVIGVQPTGDGTPHWHVVVFNDPCESELIDKLIEKYFRTNDNPHQIDYEPCDSVAGATAYAMRMLQYVTRQVGDTTKDKADKIEAHNASAWASTYRTRRYRTSNCKATLWRLSRKKDIEVPDDMKECAMAGKYFEFIKCVEKYQAKIVYVEKTNRYGEQYKVPKGVQYIRNGNPCASVSLKKWELAKVGSGKTYTYSKEPSKTQPLPHGDINSDSEIIFGLDYESAAPPERWLPQDSQVIH